MAKFRLKATVEGRKVLPRLRREASALAHNILRAARRGDCATAAVSMRRLDILNASIPNYVNTIRYAPMWPSHGTVARIRRAFNNRCSIKGGR